MFQWIIKHINIIHSKVQNLYTQIEILVWNHLAAQVWATSWAIFSQTHLVTLAVKNSEQNVLRSVHLKQKFCVARHIFVK
jgi:hypothetical protein